MAGTKKLLKQEGKACINNTNSIIKCITKKEVTCILKNNGNNNRKERTINLYFVRHGETVLNALDLVQGISDSALTKNGIEITEKAALGMKDIEFHYVYSSDMLRATQTAKILLKHNEKTGNVDINERKGLREVNFGKFESMKNSEMWSFTEEDLEEMNIKDKSEMLGSGFNMKKAFGLFARKDETKEAETYEEVAERGEKALNDIINDLAEDTREEINVLITTHGAFIGILFNGLDINVEAKPIENASCSLVQYKNNKFKVKSFSDTKYIKKGEKLYKKID